MEIALDVRSDPEAASARAATLLIEAVREHRSIALSGGSTPRRAYELAAQQEGDWSGAVLWLADERFVPADDPRANRSLVRTTVLDRVARPPRWHPVPLDAGTVVEAACAYDAQLRREGLPSIVFLGLGSDGHTASLFPGMQALDERERLVVATEAGLEPFVPRVTLTLPAVAAAERVVFLVTGPDKAAVVREAFAEAPSARVPASLARSAGGTTTVVLDRDAARLL